MDSFELKCIGNGWLLKGRIPSFDKALLSKEDVVKALMIFLECRILDIASINITEQLSNGEVKWLIHEE